MKWNFEDPNDKLCKELHAKLWKAINKYVVVCGGDASEKTIGLKREKAVVEIEKLIDQLKENHIGKCDPPYLGDPVWESQHEMSVSLLNIKVPL